MPKAKTTTEKPAKKSALVKPRVTEKAAIQAERSNVYVFDVLKEATKKTIAASVKSAYNVTPVKIRLTNVPTKRVFVRGKWGKKGGGKKAYIYLKKGDKIETI